MMRAVLLLHGPNLNLLGARDPEHYGEITLAELETRIRTWGREFSIDVRAHQSNHEGALIDTIQDSATWAAGAIVNLGALSHTSYALHDALVDFGRPVVEVHLSRVSEREEWRRHSAIRAACAASFEGLGPEGYHRALEVLDKEMKR